MNMIKGSLSVGYILLVSYWVYAWAESTPRHWSPEHWHMISRAHQAFTEYPKGVCSTDNWETWFPAVINDQGSPVCICPPGAFSTWYGTGRVFLPVVMISENKP